MEQASPNQLGLRSHFPLPHFNVTMLIIALGLDQRSLLRGSSPSRRGSLGIPRTSHTSSRRRACCPCHKQATKPCPRVRVLPHRGMDPDLVQQPQRTPQPRNPPTHRHRGNLPQPPSNHPPSRSRPRRTKRRMGRRPTLPQPRHPHQITTHTPTHRAGGHPTQTQRITQPEGHKTITPLHRT